MQKQYVVVSWKGLEAFVESEAMSYEEAEVYKTEVLFSGPCGVKYTIEEVVKRPARCSGKTYMEMAIKENKSR